MWVKNVCKWPNIKKVSICHKFDEYLIFDYQSNSDFIDLISQSGL